MLCQKEKLIGGMERLLYAFVNKRRANKVVDVAKLTNKTFSKFI